MPMKNKHYIKCDYCKAKAVVNFQKIWVKFIIDKNGEYKQDNNFYGAEFEQPTEEDNVHLCKRHLKEFLKGEI
jgi:hypothetical protein